MKKKLKKVLIVLGSVLLFFLLIIAIASFVFFYRKPFVKGIVEKQIEKRTGIQLTIGTLDYELFPLRIEAGVIEFATELDETEVDVSIEKLALKGDFHRIQKKKKPYFETIEADGVRIISHSKESRKKIAVEDILHGLSSGMSYVQNINLKNSAVEFNFPEQTLILQGADISLATSGSQDTIAYTLICREAEGIGQPRTYKFQNAIQGSGILSLKEKPSLEGRFIFTSNDLSYAAKQDFFNEIRLNFMGELNSDKNEFRFPTLELEIPSFLSLTGSLDIISKDELILLIRPSIRIDDLDRIFHLAKDQLPRQFVGLDLSGSALFEGEARIAPKHPEQKESISGKVLLNPSRIKYHSPDYRLDTHISGSFDIKSFPDNQNVSGRLQMVKSSFAGKDLELSGINMDVPFRYDHKRSRIDIPILKASASSLSLDIPDRKFKTESPYFSGQAFIDLKKRIFRISKANIELQPFPPFGVEAQAGLASQDTKSLTISAQSSKISFKTLMDFFSFAIPQKVIDWQPEGWLNFQVEAQALFREKQKLWDLSAKLEAFDVQFHDQSFTIAGESLQPTLIVKGNFDHTLDDIEFSAKLELSHGESLWKDFFVDWNKLPILGTIGGRYHVSQRRLTDLSVDGVIPEWGRLSAKGHLDLQEFLSGDLRIMASELQLAPLHAFLSQKQAVSPKRALWKGEAECQIDAKIEKNAFSMDGYLKLKDASWTDGDDKLSVQGVEAHIPLHYQQNSLKVGGGNEPLEKGYLTFRKILSPYLDLSSLRLDISSTKNGYAIQPFELDIFGLKAYVGETLIEYGSDALNFKALTSFALKDGDLSKLPFSSKDFRLAGKLSMDLPQVKISPDNVSAKGKGTANTFGGNITFENIQVNQPFSKDRTISCDVKLSGLDLEKITDSIPFGRVTGTINGEIKELALSYGQPERFNIRIESEKRKGIPQRFSLKATNDLAILGTGEKTPFSPQSGWTRFVKDFRYEKIGIACSLKNDIFSLRGTIHGKGVEYLVKGSGLFAINVVNKQTRNQIQFKDMLSRLKRIGQSKQSP